MINHGHSYTKCGSVVIFVIAESKTPPYILSVERCANSIGTCPESSAKRSQDYVIELSLRLSATFCLSIYAESKTPPYNLSVERCANSTDRF